MRLFLSSLLVCLAVSHSSLAQEDWAAVTRPAPGTAKVIGSAAAGCLRGAQALTTPQMQFQILRPSRNRAWGHPATVAFVHQLTAMAGEEGISGLLIGDMGQPRGGPMPSGHASHQNGVDVDIWFRLAAKPLSTAELETPQAVNMVKGTQVNPATWGRPQARLVELAARMPGGERIFVNPAIKQDLCRSTSGEDRDWLRKLRPWWGHDEHFHVRMACPTDSPECEIQKPMPEGDGCGAELDSWLTKPTSPAPPSRPHVQSRPLPDSCAAVLSEK